MARKMPAVIKQWQSPLDSTATQSNQMKSDLRRVAWDLCPHAYGTVGRHRAEADAHLSYSWPPPAILGLSIQG